MLPLTSRYRLSRSHHTGANLGDHILGSARSKPGSMPPPSCIQIPSRPKIPIQKRTRGCHVLGSARGKLGSMQCRPTSRCRLSRNHHTGANPKRPYSVDLLGVSLLHADRPIQMPSEPEIPIQERTCGCHILGICSDCSLLHAVPSPSRCRMSRNQHTGRNLRLPYSVDLPG